MNKDIQHCKAKGLTFAKEVECCFQICNKYWRELKLILAVYQFDKEDEEIYFFKNIKPQFTSEIQYYNLLYHSELFQPDSNREEFLKFWKREIERMEKFMRENSVFYNYYKSGSTYMDNVYFLRDNYKFDFLAGKAFENERRTSTNHDHLVAEIMALEKYCAFARKQLDQILPKHPPAD